LKPLLPVLAVLALSGVLAYPPIFDRLPAIHGSSRGDHAGPFMMTAAGRRFFVSAFASDRLIASGAYSPIRLQSIGFGVRIQGGSEPSGFYLVFISESDSLFAVTVRGHRLNGQPMLDVHGRMVGGSPLPQGNLLKETDDLSAKTVWWGNGVATKSDAGASRVSFDNTHSYLYQTANEVTRPGNSYQASFEARLVSGGPDVTLFVNRGGGYDGEARTVTLTPDWKRYSLRHRGVWGAQSSLQLGLNRVTQDVVFEIRNLRLIAEPPIEAATRFWPETTHLDSTVYSAQSSVDAPEGARTFVVRGADSIGLLLYGLGPFSYQLDRVCVGPISGEDQAPQQAADCRPVTNFQ
jgi:hypothetical protein